MKTIFLALPVAFVGFATAQTTMTQKAPTKTASAPKPKPETKEHKVIKAQLAETQRLYDQVDAMMKEPKKDTSGYSAEQLRAHLKALKDSLELYENLIVEVARKKNQLEHVDACTALFHRTIDKKTSDLTVRETALVKECTAMDLYPLDMTEQPAK
jgi:hypothetical protein